MSHPSLEQIRLGIESYTRDHFDFSFNPASPRVRLHECTFGTEEIYAAVETLLSTYVTMGAKTLAFEQACCRYFGFEHGVMVNSGSSANLLAVAALVNPVTKNRLLPGDEVIVPALSWSTTVWPLIQCGLIPVIVDIDPITFNISPDQVRQAIGPRTRAIMPVHVYGNPCDMHSLLQIADENQLIIIEDCCESLGALYDGKSVGLFGEIGTFSFYYSHHITTMEGGICHTRDFELAETLRILRAHGWVRETQDRKKYEALYSHIDPRFLFVNIGYNLRPTDVQAAFGPIQLKKLESFIEIRTSNACYWKELLAPYSKFFRIQEETPLSRHSWFGFPMVIQEEAGFSPREFRAYLAQHHIENRPLIAGNLADQPAMKLFAHRVVGDLKVSKKLMTHGFTFGNHQGVNESARSYIVEIITQFLKSKQLI